MLKTPHSRPLPRIFFALIGLLSCASPPEVGTKQAELAGGSNLGTHASRAAVVTLVEKDSPSTRNPFCTGTLLNHSTVLTAAHCFVDRGWETTAYESQPGVVITSIASDGDIHMVGGSDQFEGRRRAFIDDSSGPIHLDTVSETEPPTAFEPRPTGIELLANHGDVFYAAGWQGLARDRQAVLYVYVASTAVAKKIVLGRGSPTAMHAYLTSAGDKRLAVALYRQFGEDGSQTGRSDASAIDIDVDNPTGALSKRNIFYAVEDTKITAIDDRGEGVLLFAGNRFASTTKPVLVHAVIPSGNEEWTTLEQPLGAGTLVDMVTVGEDLVTLINAPGSQAQSVVKWNVNVLGPSTPVVVNGAPVEFTEISQQLATHFAIINGSPWRRSDTPARFKATSLTKSDARLYLSGTASFDGRRRPLQIGLTHELAVAKDFGFNGVALPPESAYDVRAVATNGDGSTHLTGTRRNATGTPEFFMTSYRADPQFRFPVLVRESETLEPVYAKGLDLALVSLRDPIEVADMPRGAIGPVLRCVGSGSTPSGNAPVLLEGAIAVTIPSPSDAYLTAASQKTFGVKGDSGGPCFNASNELAAIMVTSTSAGTNASANGPNGKGHKTSFATRSAIQSFLDEAGFGAASP